MIKKEPRKPAFVIFWEFHVKSGKRREFETIYGPDGTWAKFFRNGKGYIRTELLRDLKTPRRYLTLDVWTTRQAYLRFKKENLASYQVIDEKCISLTEGEALIGEFQSQSCGDSRPRWSWRACSPVLLRKAELSSADSRWAVPLFRLRL